MVKNDKVLESMAHDFFPKNLISYNACIAGAEAIRKVNNMSKDTVTVTLGEFQEYMCLKLHNTVKKSIVEDGDPVQWAVFKAQPNLSKYLEEHGISSNSSLTDKQIMTISFAHAFEYELLDYIVKLERFNND